MLGFPILYLKGMRIMMFQLSGFYFKYQVNPMSKLLMALKALRADLRGPSDRDMRSSAN